MSTAKSPIRFYFKRGKWHATSDGKLVLAREWWEAISYVKCMNHKLRTGKAPTASQGVVIKVARASDPGLLDYEF